MKTIITLVFILISLAGCSQITSEPSPSIGDINMALCSQIADNDATYLDILLCEDGSILLIKIEHNGKRIIRYTVGEKYRGHVFSIFGGSLE